jgi:hypothetical protein
MANAQTYWLDVTNIGLGAAVVLLIALLLRAIMQDVHSRRQ